MSEDLKTVDTEKLVEELMSRFHGAVIASVRYEDNREARSCSFYGGAMTAIGLCEYAKDFLLNYSQQSDSEDQSSASDTQ
jgi:hypothetical protein